jgi:hypothetical protein
LDAIRRDDAAAVAVLLRVGVEATATDETGARALMHAAVYAWPCIVRHMLARGGVRQCPRIRSVQRR